MGVLSREKGKRGSFAVLSSPSSPYRQRLTRSYRKRYTTFIYALSVDREKDEKRTSFGEWICKIMC